MTIAQKIYEKIGRLPESVQAEILDFVDFMDRKKSRTSDKEWQDLSLSSAMRGMEAESLPNYTESDLKEKFQ